MTYLLNLISFVEEKKKELLKRTLKEIIKGRRNALKKRDVFCPLNLPCSSPFSYGDSAANTSVLHQAPAEQGWGRTGNRHSENK